MIASRLSLRSARAVSSVLTAAPIRTAGFSSSTVSSLEIRPLTGTIGCEVLDVDVTKATDAEMETIKQALWDYTVIFFRDQTLSPASQLEFSRKWGTPDRHPIVQGMEEFPEVMRVVREANAETTFGETWHSDNSYLPQPSMGSILYGIEIPEYGNDTLFANMYAAYDGLSDGMKEMLEGMKAVHGAGRAFSVSDERKDRYEGNDAMKYEKSEALHREVEHPVIRTHPVTGKKAIYVNTMFTYRFVGMTDEESAPLLQYLFSLCDRPEIQCRFRWQPGSVAIWDNRCVQHIAINDYSATQRTMQRVTIEGETPM